MPAVPTRPTRPPVPAPARFELLDQTHQQVMKMLGSLSELLNHMDDSGPDDEARQLAGEVHAFFEGNVRQHHAEEEARVFPALLNSQDADLIHHVKRLQQDHGWLEEDWQMLSPQLEAIARGYNWYDLAMLRQAVPVFIDLNRDHVVLEESVVYPAAKAYHQQLADRAKRSDD